MSIEAGAIQEDRGARLFVEWIGAEATGTIIGAGTAFAAESTIFSQETHQRGDLTTQISGLNSQIAGEQSSLSTLGYTHQGKSPAAQTLRSQITGQQQQVEALQVQVAPLEKLDNEIMATCVLAGLVIATAFQTGRIGTRRVRRWWQGRGAATAEQPTA